jgi:hypothetical protein
MGYPWNDVLEKAMKKLFQMKRVAEFKKEVDSLNEKFGSGRK